MYILNTLLFILLIVAVMILSARIRLKAALSDRKASRGGNKPCPSSRKCRCHPN